MKQRQPAIGALPEDPCVELIERLIYITRATTKKADSATIHFAADVLGDLEKRRAELTSQPELPEQAHAQEVAA